VNRDVDNWLDIFATSSGLFASKPAPTVDRISPDNSVNCGSGLAREGGLEND